MGRPWQTHPHPPCQRPSQDKPGWISSAVYRINPSEGEGVNLTVKSGQKRNKYSHERSSPSSRNDWLNKHKQHEPCRIRSQLYVQSSGLKSFRAGHDQLILQIQGGVLWFSPFFFFFPFKVSPARCKEEKSHSASWAGFCSCGNSKTPQHFNYSTSQVFLAFYLLC